MALILDTNIWIALSTGEIRQPALSSFVEGRPTHVSVITLGELQFGIHVTMDPLVRAGRSAAFDALAKRSALSVSAQTAAHFGVICAALRSAGRSPRPRFNDMWIAAQCVEHSFALLTLNPSDFAGLPGVRVIDAKVVLHQPSAA